MLRAAQEAFLLGKLNISEALASDGANRLRKSNPDWSKLFRLLQAESAAWRGNYNEAIVELAKIGPDPADRTANIQRLSILGLSHARMHEFPAAQRYLSQANSLCWPLNSIACGEYFRSQGALAMEQGDYPQAFDLYSRCLAFAKSKGLKWDEAVALMNLGGTRLAEERFDEAIDWLTLADAAAAMLDAGTVQLNVQGNLGYAYLSLGDRERALQFFTHAEQRAAELGDTEDQLTWLTMKGLAEADANNISAAVRDYQQALGLSRQINSKEDEENILTALALVALTTGNAAQAQSYAQQTLAMAQASASSPDMMDAIAIQMQAAALVGDRGAALRLLQQVENSADTQTSLKMACEHSIARLFERQGATQDAQKGYKTALATFEGARAQIVKDESRLPFIANATGIYDDYIHFLITQNKPEEALLTADQSRARTLAQGLGADLKKQSLHAVRLDLQAIARKANATLLFYWLGEQRSYLWAVTPARTTLFTLPSQQVIAPLVERYRRSLLGPDDPLQSNDEVGRALYDALVAPAVALLPAGSTVMILADGPLSLLNFDTLLAPGEKGKKLPHYWIDDVTLVSAPSLAMLASAAPAKVGDQKLLLLGDSVSPGANYPELPFAPLEIKDIQRHFTGATIKIYSRDQANPTTYLNSSPQQYSYIHFVAHGVASRTDPLNSAIILSRTNATEDSFKLYARDIMRHPIDASLVTISTCYGSGTRAYAGEGLVGLSWAFLRAGAHNAIGALWEASDDSTPALMDNLYEGLQSGKTPAAALRQAKLKLLHSNNVFRKPFYWAPFQIYSRL